MPFIINGRRGGRIVAAVAAALSLTAAPALATTAAPFVSTAAGCDSPLSQPFRTAGDNSNYYLAPGGNIEGSLTGWTLAGGAKVAATSAPAVTGGSLGAKSLEIPSGGSVTTAPICVAAHSPNFRFQARNLGASASGLKVEVVYLTTGKATGSDQLAALSASPAWAPTKQVSLTQGQFGVNGTTGQATIAFRFTAAGTGGRWQVDDVYVDPYRRF
jgi:hypothetical protein